MMKSLLQQDLAAAKELFDQVNGNKEQFLLLLQSVLELATFVPVCTAEYGDSAFARYNPEQLILDDAIKLIQDYGFQIVKEK